MKKILNQLMMVAALMGGAMSVTSCLFGEVDNPVGKTEAEIEIEQVKEVVALLEEAQETGSLTSMYYTLGDTDYEAVFKKEGDQFVLQELKSDKAATRHWEDLGTALEIVDIAARHIVVDEGGKEVGGGEVGGEGTVDNINIEKRPGEKGDISGSVMEEPTSDPNPATIIDEHGVNWEIDDDALYDNFGVANREDYQWTDEDEEDYQNPVDEGDAAADDEPAIAPADQALHFTVTDKATNEVLINSYTNLGNCATQEQTVSGAQLKSNFSVNGRTKRLGTGNKSVRIVLPSGTKVEIKYGGKIEHWNELIKKQNNLNLSVENKKVKYKNFWVLRNGKSDVSYGSDLVDVDYGASTKVNGLKLYSNVNKSIYHATSEKNNFRNGDKFYVRLEFNQKSAGAKMRDKFFVERESDFVNVKKVEGTQNVFEITANVTPTGENKIQEFDVSFIYTDYGKNYLTCTLKGGVRLDRNSDANLPPAAEIDWLYKKMDKDGWPITVDYADAPIGVFISGFKIQTLTEPYAKALAEKISAAKSFQGVAILMGGNTESGFDLYVLNGSNSGKVHLAANEKPTSLVGLTLFYIEKEDEE